MRASQWEQTTEVGQASGQMLVGLEEAKMPAFQPPVGPSGQLLHAVQMSRGQWKQDEALLQTDIAAHTRGSAPAPAPVSAAFLSCAHPGPRTGQAWRMRRTAGPPWMTNRFKGLDLIDRVPDELWTEVHDIVQETGIKTIPKKKKCKKARWLSEEAL